MLNLFVASVTSLKDLSQFYGQINKKHVRVQRPWNRNLFITSRLFFVYVRDPAVLVNSPQLACQQSWSLISETWSYSWTALCSFLPLLSLFSVISCFTSTPCERILSLTQTQWAVITITVQNCHDLPIVFMFASGRICITCVTGTCGIVRRFRLYAATASLLCSRNLLLLMSPFNKLFEESVSVLLKNLVFNPPFHPSSAGLCKRYP